MPMITEEVALLGLIVALMVVPRVLQRWRLPAPLASFGLGLAAALAIGQETHDTTLALLATLGISSLFLFAGLEVDLADFVRGRWALLRHVAVRLLVIGASAGALMHLFELPWQAATLFALAIVTPSAGFILDTLAALHLDEEERYWIKMKAITGELLALVMLFVVLQSTSLVTLATSALALGAMVLALPVVMLALGRYVVPHARGSEFSMLMMIGVISAWLTYKLGVYYLVGAFLAGFIARLLRGHVPGLASDTNLHAIRMFASFFVPFYFFHKGMGIPAGALTTAALGLGLAMAVLILPLRVGVQWLQRRMISGESRAASLRVAAALSPTLIFTLVLAGILHERYGIPDLVYGGLLVYAAVATVLPSLLLARPVDFDLLPDLPGQADPEPVRQSAAT